MTVRCDQVNEFRNCSARLHRSHRVVDDLLYTTTSVSERRMDCFVDAVDLFFVDRAQNNRTVVEGALDISFATRAQ